MNDLIQVRPYLGAIVAFKWEERVREGVIVFLGRAFGADEYARVCDVSPPPGTRTFIDAEQTMQEFSLPLAHLTVGSNVGRVVAEALRELHRQNEWDGSFEDFIRCPHCGEPDEEYTDYPSFGDCRDGDTAETTCARCGSEFVVTLSVTYEYGTKPKAVST